MEYSNRNLAPSASTGSLHDRNNLGGRSLNPSPSADSLLKRAQVFAAPAPISPQRGSPISIMAHGQGGLGQSLSMSSLLSIESDSSAPAPVAPPRSAQLNTGEVLQPYQTPLGNSRMMHPQMVQPGGPQSIVNGRSGRNPTAGNLPRAAHQMPSMVQTAGVQPGIQPSQTMAVVHPQSVISQREVPPPAPPPPQETSQAAENSQSTWIIEEVIDFGVPLDEGMVRECEDNGYPLGCKSLSGPPRGNVNLFDNCTYSVCYDESQTTEYERRDGRDLC